MTQKIIVCLAILATCTVHVVARMTNTVPNFEITNRTNEEITVSLTYEGRMGQILGRPMQIEPYKALQTQLTELATPLIITIIKGYEGETLRFLVTPCPQGDRCNKVIFLKFENNMLQPLKKMGRFAATSAEFGRPLANNIDSSDISQLLD